MSLNPAFDLSQNDIKSMMFWNNVIILTSGTGLGKTTRVPLYTIELFTRKGLNGEYEIKQQQERDGWAISNTKTDNKGTVSAYDCPFIDDNSIILCAQPKEILARENGNSESFISKSIRDTRNNNDDIITFKGKNNQGKYGKALTFVTCGILKQLMISNPYLNNDTLNVSCVIVDEAHERSTDIDVVLALLKQVLLVRPNFKIIIMSATINKDIFTKYFYNAPAIHIEATTIGKPLVVTDIWWPYLINNNNIDSRANGITHYIARALYVIEEIIIKKNNPVSLNDKISDIIVFVPGNKDMDDIWNHISEDIKNYYDIYKISATNKEKFLDNGGTLTFNTMDNLKKDIGHKKRIFLATNAIESSITINTLGYVIDCGISNQSDYSAKLDMHLLRLLHITQASANQRKGRVGRIRSGICYHLYSEINFKNMDAYNEPEILTGPIENLFISLLNRDTNFLNFDFIQPPSQHKCNYTMEKLKLYGIIPKDFNIYTDVKNLDDEYKRKINLYSRCSYFSINFGNDKYPKYTSITIPNILLQILFNYIDNGNKENYSTMLEIIFCNTLYLNDSNLSKYINKFLLAQTKTSSNKYNSNSELILIHKGFKDIINNSGNHKDLKEVTKYQTLFINFIKDFIKKYNKAVKDEIFNLDIWGEYDFVVDTYDVDDIILYINGVLESHKNTCVYGRMDYVGNNSIYFKTLGILPEYDTKGDVSCTYVNCELNKTQFNYQLLTYL